MRNRNELCRSFEPAVLGTRLDLPEKQLHVHPFLIPDPDFQKDNVDGITERTQQRQRVPPHRPLDVCRRVGLFSWQGRRDGGEQRVGMGDEDQTDEAANDE
jgi:hypothetical protein